MHVVRAALFLLPCCALAQDCSIPFTQALFGVQQEADIFYGTATRFNNGTDSLRLNLYKPVGDGQTERPLVVAVHGGGFTGGHRNDLNDYCATLASMGWACATISYRLGYYGNGLFEPPYAYDPNELRRAIYRAQQDAKGAIRFLKGRHLQDSTSTTNVLLNGFSAGAITALHAAYLDQESEKPAAANAIGDVQHFLTFYPRPDLGPIDGDLNQNGSDASVLGVTNFYGAVLDTALIDGDERPALYSYHQTGDPIVACGHNRPYWGIGLGAPDNHPYLFGSCAMDPHVEQLGYAPGHYQFTQHAGNAHEVHDPAGILLASLQWGRDLFCGGTTGVATEDVSNGIVVYPNPAEDRVMVRLSQPGPALVQLFDMTGKLLQQRSITNSTGAFELSGLSTGVVLLRITLSDGHMLQSRLLVQ